MSDDTNQYWLPWPGPTGTTGPSFLGVTGAVTGPAFFGVTGATGPTGLNEVSSHVGYLFNRARIELVGASDTMIRQIMYDVFHEFFNDTSLWLEGIPGQIVPNAVLYQLVPGQVQSVGDAFPPGVIIKLAGLTDINYVPISADMPEPGILRLQYNQTAAMSVWATVIKNVKRPQSGELPDVPLTIVQTYEPWLLAGIKGLLQLQANRPYTDQKIGQLNYQTFRQGVNMGRVNALRRNTFGGQAWAFPQQFRTRSQHGWAVSVGNVWRF